MNEPTSATRERIARVCHGIGCALDAGAEQALENWLGELRAWNRKIDLTAARGEDELCDLMLADAALFARELARAAPGSAPLTLVDVGSGAGAPGLGLAILRPDLRVCLCEPLHKRTAFLRSVAGKLALVPPRLEIVAARVEALGARRFAVATSRATLAPDAWLRAGSALAPEVWLLLAREEPPRVPGLALDRDCHYRWPLTGAERRAVRYVASPA